MTSNLTFPFASLFRPAWSGEALVPNELATGSSGLSLLYPSIFILSPVSTQLHLSFTFPFYFTLPSPVPLFSRRARGRRSHVRVVGLRRFGAFASSVVPRSPCIHGLSIALRTMHRTLGSSYCTSVVFACLATAAYLLQHRLLESVMAGSRPRCLSLRRAASSHGHYQQAWSFSCESDAGRSKWSAAVARASVYVCRHSTCAR